MRVCGPETAHVLHCSHSGRTEEELSVARKGCEELRGKLDRAAEERQVLEMKTTAEIDDLCKTKSTLEERLIELIR